METKTLFRNITNGYVGAITIDRRGERRAVAVGPGDEVALSEEEQQETANAPRDPRDNPFLKSSTDVRDGDSGAVIEAGEKPQLEAVAESRPIGNQRPIGTPAQGSYAPGEEVGTPEAAAATG